MVWMFMLGAMKRKTPQRFYVLRKNYDLMGGLVVRDRRGARLHRKLIPWDVCCCADGRPRHI
jgi:hypothetical protein